MEVGKSCAGEVSEYEMAHNGLGIDTVTDSITELIHVRGCVSRF